MQNSGTEQAELAMTRVNNFARLTDQTGVTLSKVERMERMIQDIHEATRGCPEIGQRASHIQNITGRHSEHIDKLIQPFGVLSGRLQDAGKMKEDMASMKETLERSTASVESTSTLTMAVIQSVVQSTERIEKETKQNMEQLINEVRQMSLTVETLAARTFMVEPSPAQAMTAGFEVPETAPNPSRWWCFRRRRPSPSSDGVSLTLHGGQV